MNKRFFIAMYALFICAGIVAFVACEDDEKEPSLTVDETPVAAIAAAGTYSISVSSNGHWAAVVEEADSKTWCTLTHAIGKNDGIITINIAENTDILERSATVKITMNDLTKRVQFNQAAAEGLFLIVDESTIEAVAEAGTYPIEVSSNGDWTAVVEDADSNTWCTLTNSTGTNNGTVTVNVTENTKSTSRSAVIIFTLDTLTRRVPIEQIAAGQYLIIDKTSITATVDSTTYSIIAYSNREWTVEVEDPANHKWCTLNAQSGVDTATITVTVGKNLLISERSAVVIFTADTIIKRCTINQAAATPFLTIDETVRNIPSDAASYTIDVKSNGAWTVAVDNAAEKSWCTLSANSGEGDGNITVEFEANSVVGERMATVKFTMGTIVKTVRFIQAPEDSYLRVVEEGVEITQITLVDTAVTQKINVESNGSWKVSKQDNTPWVTITGMGIGIRENNGAFNAVIGRNPLAMSRNVEITVALTNESISKMVTITQEGTVPAMNFKAALPQVTASAQNKSVQIEASVAWRVEETIDWLDLESITGTGDGEFVIVFTENTNAEERIGEITLRSTSHTSLMEKTLTVRQNGAGNIEEGITINGVTWSTRNLESTGVWTSTMQEKGKFFQFDNSAAFVNTGAVSNTDDWRASTHEGDWVEANNPCPSGWRLPTKADFESLNAGSTYRLKVGSTSGYFFGTPAAIASGPTIADPKGCVYFPSTNKRTSTASSGVSGSAANQGAGNYWTSTSGLTAGYGNALTWTNAGTGAGAPAVSGLAKKNEGHAVRCVKKTE